MKTMKIFLICIVMLIMALCAACVSENQPSKSKTEATEESTVEKTTHTEETSALEEPDEEIVVVNGKPYVIHDWRTDFDPEVNAGAFAEYDGPVAKEEVEKARLACYEWIVSESEKDGTIDKLRLGTLIPTMHIPISRMLSYIQKKYQLSAPEDWIAFQIGPDIKYGAILIKDRANKNAWRVVYSGFHFGYDIALELREKEKPQPELSEEDFAIIEPIAQKRLADWIAGKDLPVEDFGRRFRLSYRLIDEDPENTVIFRQGFVNPVKKEIEAELKAQFGLKPEDGTVYSIEIDEGNNWPLYFTFFKEQKTGEWHLIENLWGSFGSLPLPYDPAIEGEMH